MPANKWDKRANGCKRAQIQTGQNGCARRILVHVQSVDPQVSLGFGNLLPHSNKFMCAYTYIYTYKVGLRGRAEFPLARNAIEKVAKIPLDYLLLYTASFPFYLSAELPYD